MKTYTKEQLVEIIEKHKKWLSGNDGGACANLYGASLRYANLYGANLRYANLYGANLEGANLEGANLYGANLEGANLEGANLYGANLRYANLYGANLEGANLEGANLYGANLEGANLEGANLEGANLYGANLEGANLHGADILCLGNMRNIKTIQADRWAVGYTHNTMQIGCQQHLIADWWGFSDEEISGMDCDALAWWRVWKPILQSIISASPAEPTGVEQ